MSMRGEYAPPRVTPLEGAAYAGPGADRRSRDPVDRLGRSLNTLCLEATDRFEIVAHLEAMGLDTPENLRRLGVRDRFDLAEALYLRTPMRFGRRRPARRLERDWAGPIAMVLAFVATFAFGALPGAMMLAPSLLVLVWSQAGAVLLNRAREELSEEARRDALALLLQVGAAGVAIAWAFVGFELQAGAAALLWFGVAGLTWGDRKRWAVALPLLTLAGLAATGAGLAPPGTAVGVAIAAPLVLLAPLAARDPRPILGWAPSRAGDLAGAALYGAGQALLVLALVREEPTDAQVLYGAALLATILLLSRALLLALKARLVRGLWRERHGDRFVARVRRSLTLYAGVYLLPVAGALAVARLAGPQPWFFHWYAFALFGLCLALGVVALTLGDPWTPAIGFAAAAGLAFLASFLVACAVLAVVLFVLLIVRSGRVERYAIHLL